MAQPLPASRFCIRPDETALDDDHLRCILEQSNVGVDTRLMGTCPHRDVYTAPPQPSLPDVLHPLSGDQRV
jgi:hypothetical protein